MTVFFINISVVPVCTLYINEVWRL